MSLALPLVVLSQDRRGELRLLLSSVPPPSLECVADALLGGLVRPHQETIPVHPRGSHLLPRRFRNQHRGREHWRQVLWHLLSSCGRVCRFSGSRRMVSASLNDSYRRGTNAQYALTGSGTTSPVTISVGWVWRYRFVSETLGVRSRATFIAHRMHRVTY